MAMQRKTVPFEAWVPDRPVYAGAQSIEARNVLPAAQGYVCLESPAYMGTALGEKVVDALSRRMPDSSICRLVATTGGLYVNAADSWTALLSTTAVSTDRSLCLYGDDAYCLYGTSLYRAEYDGGYNDPAVLVQAAPFAKHMGVVKDFLVLGNLTGAPSAIRWSAIDDPTDWPTVGSDSAQYKMSDQQVFPVGGTVQAIVGGVGGVDGLVFQQEALTRMTFVGPPYIFQFDPIDRAAGTIAPLSPIVAGPMCYYLSTAGWKGTNGSSVADVGRDKVDRWFFEHCTAERIEEVRGTYDRKRGLCIWAFPARGCPENQFDSLLIFSPSENKWSHASVSGEIVFSDYADGVTLDQLDQFSQSVDGLPFKSLDASILKAGDSVLSLFGTSHQPGSFSGPALEAVVDTAEIGGQHMMLHGIRPIVDRGDASCCAMFRDREGDMKRATDYSAQSRDGVCYQHRSAAYFSARVKIPAGDPWINGFGCELLYEEEGGL